MCDGIPHIVERPDEIVKDRAGLLSGLDGDVSHDIIQSKKKVLSQRVVTLIQRVNAPFWRS